MAAGGDNCPAVPGSALTSHCIAATRRKCRIVPWLPGSCGNTRCSFCLFIGRGGEIAVTWSLKILTNLLLYGIILLQKTGGLSYGST